jgi:hypothetical protein
VVTGTLVHMYVEVEIGEKSQFTGSYVIVRARSVCKANKLVKSSKAAAAGAPHKNQQMTAMTRSAEEITREDHIDLRVLVEYIKVDLFPKAKFVLGKDEWDVGGIIYKDYVKCCQGRMGLRTMTELERERYMETVWMRALNKKVQKKALVQKRSAIYTVMQNKFTGELHTRGLVLLEE